jgi:hypothetical protein
MKTLHSGLAAAMLSAAIVLPTFSTNTAIAAPIFVPKTITAQPDVIQVRDGWYRGYRGYRNYRSGYRYNNGWWFPAGAFVAGALIGGAIANNNYYGGYYPRYYGGYGGYGGYYGGYGGYYGGGYYPRYYAPRYYAPARVYYPPRGTAYRQGYRDGYRDGVGARYYNDITCTQRLSDAGMC